MNCSTLTSDLLLDFADRKVLPPQRTAMEEHITECPACRARFDDVRSVAAGLRRLVDSPTQAALLNQLDQSVIEALRKEWKSPRERAWIARWIFVSAAAAVIAAVGLFIHMTGNGPATPEVRYETARINEPEVPAIAELKPVPPATIERMRVDPAPAPVPVSAPPPEITVFTPAEYISLPRPPEESFRPARIVGDVNNDGRINSADSLMLLDFIINGGTGPDLDLADCNGNGRIDIGDALAIAQQAESRP